MSQANDNKPTRKPLGKTELFTILGFALTGFIFFLLEVLSNYTPTKFGVVVFLLAWIPLLLIHEGGHAITAHLLNWRIKRTVIGTGKLLWLGQFLGANIEFRAVPIEGFVQIQPKANQRFNQGKHALIFFMGPGIELILFALIATFLGWGEIFNIEDNYGKIIAQGIAFAALVGAVINLIPVKTEEGAVSDGLGIIYCLFSANEAYQQWANEADSDENSREI